MHDASLTNNLSLFSIFALIALWIYLFIYSYRFRIIFPWGFMIIVLGVLVSGIGYSFYRNQVVVISISFPFIVGLLGVLWDISGIRDQFYVRNTKDGLGFIVKGIISGLLLGIIFMIAVQESEYIIDPRYSAFAYIYIGIQAGIAEELLFRGFLLNYLRAYKVNYIIAIFFQALIFVLLHLQSYLDNLPAILVVFVMGIMAGFLTWKNNNLVPALVLHIVFNLITVVWWLSVT